MRIFCCHFLCLPNRAQVECPHGSQVLRKLMWWFKSRWKRALRWERSCAIYSYDFHSYSQNFDDGSLDDEHVSPLAPSSKLILKVLDSKS
ncbi:hypothetical protein NMG60_11034653 [Bertholletia excelsa]